LLAQRTAGRVFRRYAHRGQRGNLRGRPRATTRATGPSRGGYDLGAHTGWVSVGIDHDTAAFAVASIRYCWQTMGRRVYPHARRLLITADAGGSNGARLRLWRVELQKLADRLRVPIPVCHFPPGTSRWNQIEHHALAPPAGSGRRARPRGRPRRSPRVRRDQRRLRRPRARAVLRQRDRDLRTAPGFRVALCGVLWDNAERWLTRRGREGAAAPPLVTRSTEISHEPQLTSPSGIGGAD